MGKGRRSVQEANHNERGVEKHNAKHHLLKPGVFYAIRIATGSFIDQMIGGEVLREGDGRQRNDEQW